MALIERLMGVEDKLSVHQTQAVIAEWARGNMTGVQAQTAMTFISRTKTPLTAADITEAQALVATVPTGATATNKADRALKLKEIDDVLLLVDKKCPPYDTAAAIRTRLGI